MSEVRRIFSLTGDTLIPISFVGLILGAGYWINGISIRIENAEHRIDDSESAQQKFQDFTRSHLEEQTKALGDIKVQASGIEARLDILLDMKKKRQ